MARPRHESRDRADRWLIRWLKEDATASAGDLWSRAEGLGWPMPARATWNKWVTRARQALGIRRAGRPPGSSDRSPRSKNPKRRQDEAPSSGGCTMLTEDDIWLALAHDLPREHVEGVARRVRDMLAHMIRRRCGDEREWETPPTADDFVRGLGVDERTQRLLLSAGLGLANARQWTMQDLQPDVLRELAA